ncbi:MAG: DUF4422 domain-containing protein [Marinilabiliaceae bacterium]
MDIKIIVATHKDTLYPSDGCYLPLHVGCEGKPSLGLQGDNTGDNISTKNRSFCELTGIYWAWKNLDAEYVGMSHYRRYFTKGFRFTNRGRWNAILKKEDYEKLLKKSDLILPQKRHYVVETNRSHYDHAHDPNELQQCEKVIAELIPDALDAFHKVMNRRSSHMFNLFIMKRELFDDYCNFIFTILFELEKRIDTTNYDAYAIRVYGFVSELLMDVWVEYRHLNYKEQNVSFLGQRNWIRKIIEFLKRKYLGVRVYRG